MNHEIIKFDEIAENIENQQNQMSVNVVVYDENERSSSLEIHHIDDAIKFIEKLSEKVKNTEYSDDKDQKELKKLRAQANKFTSQIKLEMKEFEKKLFEEARASLKLLDFAVSQYVLVLQEKIEECESSYRAQKNLMIKECFEKALIYSDIELEVEEIFDPKWLNRSTSKKMISQEITFAIEKIESLAKIAGSNDQAKSLLKSQCWNLEKSILSYYEDLEAQKEKEIEIEPDEDIELEEEIESKEEEIESKEEENQIEKYIVYVPKCDVEFFKRQMTSSGWLYDKK